MKTIIPTVSDTGVTHHMDPNHSSLLSSYRSSGGENVTLGNRDKDPIAVYGTKLVILGVVGKGGGN